MRRLTHCWLAVIFLLTALTGCDKKPAENTTPEIVKVTPFVKEILKNSVQSVIKTASFPSDLSKVNKILMYVKLECPTGGCGAWDVYANVLARERTTGTFYEIARYITPYGRDNSTRERGFVLDVTDFKSVLSGDTEIKLFTEVWTDAGWMVTVDFDFEMGKLDYTYYSIVPVMQFNQHSLAGIP